MKLAQLFVSHTRGADDVNSRVRLLSDRRVRASWPTLATCVLLTSIGALAIPASGQCTPAWQPGQGVPGVQGQSNTVYAMQRLNDGRILVGGSFTLAGDIYANNVTIFDPATSAFNKLGASTAGVDGAVLSFAATSTGEVYVGGAFALAGGINANRIARYNLNTQAWSALPIFISSGGAPVVYSMVILPDGDLLVAGSFATSAGAGASNMARYRPGTNTWSAVPQSPNARVNALLLLPSGEVVVGGNFSSAGGITTGRIARFNPITNAWSAIDLGISTQNPSTVVNSLALLSNGEVAVMGTFTSTGPAPAVNMARYNPDTNTYSTLGTGAPVDPLAMTTTDDGNLLVAGYSATNSYRMTTYTVATNTWSSLTAAVATAPIRALAELAAGTDVIVGGDFVSAGGLSVSRIARFSQSTDTYSALSTGINGSVSDLAFLSDGSIMLAGSLSLAGGVPTTGLARFSPLTKVWSNPGSLAGTSVSASAVLALPDGDVIVAGRFTSAGGVPANNIARYSPGTGAWSPLGAGTDSTVFALGRLSNGDIIVGGAFTTAGGSSAPRIARYTPSTGMWAAFPAGVGNPVRGIAVLHNDDFVVRGDGVSVNMLLRFNQPSGSFTPVGAGISESVTAMTVLSNGDLLVAGSYGTVTLMNRMRRFNVESNSWSLIGAGPQAYVFSMTPLPGGDVALGGTFGLPSRIARYNPTTGVLAPIGLGLDGSVNAILARPSGDIFAGGSFTGSGPNVAMSFARYTANACPADFDCSGVRTIDDIFVFINAWFSADPRTDVDGVNGVTVDDIFIFLNVWFAGC
jgi:hypothetical protein